jgi:integrase
MLKQLTNFFGSERQIGEIIAADIEGYKLHRRREVSGSTVNRELALLKRMLNLAIDWDLYLGSNPVRKVKFFQEINTGFRVLSKGEEKKFLASATPYIQDIALFALNTGLRIGEILSLKWEGVDLEKNLLTVFADKTHKIRPVPINSEARRVLEFWTLGRKNEFVSTTTKPENRSLISRRASLWRAGRLRSRVLRGTRCVTRSPLGCWIEEWI